MWSASWVDGELVPCLLSPVAQRRAVLCTLSTLAQGYEKSGWAVTTPEKALFELEQGNLFVFVGVHPMCISMDKPWFATEFVLIEEFVSQGIGLAPVVAIMRKAMDVMSARRFVVGTRAVLNQRHGGLAKLYEREGLAISAVELTGVQDE